MRGVLTIIACMWVLAVQAQTDPHYSQYIWNKLVINPGFTGARESISTSFIYRNQWTGIEGAPTTIAVGIHTPLKNPKLALGLNMFSDKIGPIDQFSINASYAYRFLFNEGALGLGMQLGISSFNANWKDLVAFQNGEADLFRSGQETTFGANAGFGTYFYNDLISAGFSIPNVLPVGEKVPFRKSHYYLTADYLFNIGRKDEVGRHKIALKPSMMLKISRDVNSQLDLNTHIIFVNTFALGVGYRTNNSYIFMMEYVLNKYLKGGSTQVRIGYAYDLESKEYRNASGGTHEVMLIFEYASNKNKIVSPRVF